MKSVMIRWDELIHRIKTDQNQGQQHKTDEILEGQSSSRLSSQFIHTRLLIECLIRMKDKN